MVATSKKRTRNKTEQNIKTKLKLEQPKSAKEENVFQKQLDISLKLTITFKEKWRTTTVTYAKGGRELKQQNLSFEKLKGQRKNLVSYIAPLR